MSRGISPEKVYLEMKSQGSNDFKIPHTGKAKCMHAGEDIRITTCGSESVIAAEKFLRTTELL